MPAPVHHRDDDDSISLDTEIHAVGKLAQDSAADFVVNNWKGRRAGCNSLKGIIDRIGEPGA